jgi:SPP1 gp7 family putative phage head morphogenesis protein|nr:MAG TPA: minor capsid protein [Caudoviricetes sp.]
MNEFKLGNAEKLRDRLTKEQEQEIANTYKQVADKVKKKLKSIPDNGTATSALKKQQLQQLKKLLDSEYKSMRDKIGKQIEQKAKETTQGPINAAKEFAKKLGFVKLEGSYASVPNDVISSIVTGQVYDGDWSLSSALWKDVQHKQKDINKVIADGVSMNKSAFDIAKDLEEYVDPKAKKSWDWKKVYPGVSSKIDYSAQRLARTMPAHAYQQSLEATVKNNPFIDGYIWHSGTGKRTCEICRERDGKFFAKGKLPMDHPNGRCTFITKGQSMMDISDRLADWVNGKSDKGIDKYMEDLYGKVKQEKSKGLTKAQQKKADEWDKSYKNVVEFAKKNGYSIEQTVKSILGSPPKGSKYYGGIVDEVKKAYTPPKVKPQRKSFTFKDMNRKDANSYIRKMISKLKYSPDIVDALDDYMMFSDDINAYLRGQIKTNAYKDSISVLSKAMNKDTEEIVLRGCDSKTLGINPQLSQQEIANRLVGTVFKDKGFLSTTKAESIAKEFSQRGIDGNESELPTIIAIKVPKDIGKCYIDSGLGEVLIDKGSSMEIISTELKDGILYITAEVLR